MNDWMHPLYLCSVTLRGAVVDVRPDGSVTVELVPDDAVPGSANLVTVPAASCSLDD